MLFLIFQPSPKDDSKVASKLKTLPSQQIPNTLKAHSSIYCHFCIVFLYQCPLCLVFLFSRAHKSRTSTSSSSTPSSSSSLHKLRSVSSALLYLKTPSVALSLFKKNCLQTEIKWIKWKKRWNAQSFHLFFHFMTERFAPIFCRFTFRLFHFSVGGHLFLSPRKPQYLSIRNIRSTICRWLRLFCRLFRCLLEQFRSRAVFTSAATFPISLRVSLPTFLCFQSIPNTCMQLIYEQHSNRYFEAVL